MKKKIRNTASVLRKKRALPRGPDDLKTSEGQARFLAKATEVLSSSLDYEKTLKRIASLVVPRLAEWCTIHIKEERGEIERIAVAHADPTMVRYVEELSRRYPTDYNAPQGTGQILRTGKPEFLAEITDEMLVKGTKDAEHLRIARELRLGSYMGIPLTVAGRTLGVISFCTVQGKFFTDGDFSFAQELAARAALAVDNARLYREKASFAAIVESSDDAILSKTLEGVITSWNAGAQRIYGYTAEEIIGRHLSILTPEEHWDKIPVILGKISRGEHVQSYETQRCKKNGEIIHISLTVSPVKDSHGKIVGASGIERDITELVLSRQRAQKSEEAVRTLNGELEKRVIERTEALQVALERDRANLHRLKTMLASLPLAALMLDEDGRIIELNDQYCQMFMIGLTAAEAMKVSKEELNQRFHRCLKEPDGHMSKVMVTMASRTPVLGFDIHLKDGRVIERDFVPIMDDGQLRGYLFLYRDVTRDRRIDATKSEFMSLASHQLRTPLTAIRWSFGRLQKNLAGKIGELEEQILEGGRGAAIRMADTINTMLQISRIQAEQMEVNRSRLSLRPFFEEVAQAHGADCAEKEIALSIECAESMQFFTDPQLLKEVITNLLSNAVKYTPKKGTVCLSARKQGNTVEIHIQDSGYGIPLHQQQKVFHKFFRGENVVSRDPDGTGLGLYLVSLITGLLGGDIGFESAEGRGTTFRLVFAE